MSAPSGQSFFNQAGIWGELAQKDAWFKERVAHTWRLIPEDTRSILDLGCGDGAVTNGLRDRYAILAADRSWAGLQHVSTQPIQADVSQIPLPDRSIDLTLISEVLEHLPTPVLKTTVAEIARVSRRYALISVPFEENLGLYQLRCPRCRYVFHIWGHVQRWPLRRLARLLPGFTIREHVLCGPTLPVYRPALLWLRQRAGNLWHHPSGEPVLCHRCGERDWSVAARRTIWSYPINLANRLLPKATPQPYWIVALFEKQPA